MVGLLGGPGRHEAAFGDVGDLLGVALGVGVGEQGKGGGFAGAVARGALCVDDGSDIAIERDGRSRVRDEEQSEACDARQDLILARRLAEFGG